MGTVLYDLAYLNNDYLFSVGTSQGIIVQKGADIAIVFRGTQSGVEGIPDWLYNLTLPSQISPPYLAFAPLISAFTSLVDRSSGLSNAYVIGHSLGGAIAERFMLDHSELIYSAITFGSAGVAVGRFSEQRH